MSDSANRFDVRIFEDFRVGCYDRCGLKSRRCHNDPIGWVSMELVRKRIGFLNYRKIDRRNLPIVEIRVVTEPSFPVPVEYDSITRDSACDFRAADC